MPRRRCGGERPFPDVSERPVILVNDGLSSGYAVRAAIAALRKAGAREIILAAPTAPTEVAHEMEKLVEAMYCPNLREEHPFVVSAAYHKWPEVSEAEAQALLEASREVPAS